MEKTLSLREAAELLGLDIATLWRAAEEGSLVGHKVPRGERDVWRFYQEDLEEWRAPNTVPIEAHLATLELLERRQQDLLRLQRQLTEAQFSAAQGQRLLAEHAESRFQEQAEVRQLKEELKLARTELTQWEERARHPWWKRIFAS